MILHWRPEYIWTQVQSCSYTIVPITIESEPHPKQVITHMHSSSDWVALFKDHCFWLCILTAVTAAIAAGESYFWDPLEGLVIAFPVLSVWHIIYSSQWYSCFEGKRDRLLMPNLAMRSLCEDKYTDARTVWMNFLIGGSVLELCTLWTYVA